MIAVISGSTGLVGSDLIQKLLQDEDIERVISVTRRSVDIKNKKLTEVLIPDLARLSDHQEELQGDIYFCCLGTTIKAAGSQKNFRKVDFEAVLEFAKVAQKHQAQKFVVISAMGANANSRFFYNRIKGETEKALQKLGLKSLVIFRPGLLIGSRRDFRAMERLSVKTVELLSHRIPSAYLKKFSTSSEVLAEHMLAAGKDPKPIFAVIEAQNI